MTQTTMPATLFIIDLNKPDDLDRLCNILAVRQNTGQWPSVPNIVVPPPVVIPPVVVPTLTSIRVKANMIGWVRPLPNSLPSNSAVAMLRTRDDWKTIVKTAPGWTNIAAGWIDNSVLEFK